MVPLLIIVAIIILIIVANIKIVPQSYVWVVERLGAYYSSWGTGLHVKVPFIDSTGMHNLQNLIEMSHNNGIEVVLSGVNEKVGATLKKNGFNALLGEQNICSNINLECPYGFVGACGIFSSIGICHINPGNKSP